MSWIYTITYGPTRKLYDRFETKHPPYRWLRGAEDNEEYVANFRMTGTGLGAKDRASTHYTDGTGRTWYVQIDPTPVSWRGAHHNPNDVQRDAKNLLARMRRVEHDPVALANLFIEASGLFQIHSLWGSGGLYIFPSPALQAQYGLQGKPRITLDKARAQIFVRRVREWEDANR